MEIKITVERRRMSVTQGMADVLINGVKVMDFGDEIELIKPGEKYYGPIIGGWASKSPDTSFILGMLFHPLDDLYNIGNKVEKAIRREKEQEERSAPVLTELQKIANIQGWPMRIKARGEIAHLVDVQRLAGNGIAPIYRFPGGDSLVDDIEMIPAEEGDE